jgi:hypothetical protein
MQGGNDEAPEWVIAMKTEVLEERERERKIMTQVR